MINNWKLGFRVLRHGYGLMMNVIMGLLFLILGIFFFFFEAATGSYRGGIPGQVVILCIGMLPAQMLFSLSASNIVLASPLRKKMQTSVPAVFTWSCMTFLYLVILLIRGIMAVNFPEMRNSVCNELVILGLVGMVIMLYMGIAYKYFVFSIICLIPMIFSSVYMGTWVDMNWTIFVQDSASFALAAAIGLACMAVGGLGEYLLSLLVYKAPMSKMAQAAPLRKEL